MPQDLPRHKANFARMDQNVYVRTWQKGLCATPCDSPGCKCDAKCMAEMELSILSDTDYLLPPTQFASMQCAGEYLRHSDLSRKFSL